MPEAKKHILVVDDDTRLRSLLQRYLREQGFLVSAAKDAAEAEGFLKTYLFDILIVDIMMPKVTGIEFWNGCGKAAIGFPSYCLRQWERPPIGLAGWKPVRMTMFPSRLNPKNLF